MFHRHRTARLSASQYLWLDPKPLSRRLLLFIITFSFSPRLLLLLSLLHKFPFSPPFQLFMVLAQFPSLEVLALPFIFDLLFWRLCWATDAVFCVRIQFYARSTCRNDSELCPHAHELPVSRLNHGILISLAKATSENSPRVLTPRWKPTSIPLMSQTLSLM